MGSVGTNWAGNHTYRATTIHRPRSVEELAATIGGLQAGATVRAVGSRHSFTDIGDADALVDLSQVEQPPRIDVDGRTITVAGSATYADVAAALKGTDLALHNVASLPHISVAGAIATATHGSGVENRNLAAAVTALTFVDGRGVVVHVDRGAAEFAGSVVSVGALGAVVDVTLDLVDDFDVAQTVFDDLPLDALAAQFDAVMAAAYSLSVFTSFGDVGQVWAKHRVGDEERATPLLSSLRATVADGPRHPVPGIDPTPCTEQLGRAGRWADRLPHFRMGHVPSAGDEVQSEWFVAASDGVAAIEALRASRHRFVDQLMVSELRTVAADDCWLSPQCGRDTIGFHFTWFPDVQRRGVSSAVRAVEEALAPFEPLPHWGKVFHLDSADLRRRVPHLADHVDLVARHDPEGRFRNAWWTRVFA